MWWRPSETIAIITVFRITRRASSGYPVARIASMGLIFAIFAKLRLSTLLRDLTLTMCALAASYSTSARAHWSWRKKTYSWARRRPAGILRSRPRGR